MRKSMPTLVIPWNRDLDSATWEADLNAYMDKWRKHFDYSHYQHPNRLKSDVTANHMIRAILWDPQNREFWNMYDSLPRDQKSADKHYNQTIRT